jgi:hypothetical protein
MGATDMLMSPPLNYDTPKGGFVHASGTPAICENIASTRIMRVFGTNRIQVDTGICGS